MYTQARIGLLYNRHTQMLRWNKVTAEITDEFIIIQPTSILDDDMPLESYKSTTCARLSAMTAVMMKIMKLNGMT